MIRLPKSIHWRLQVWYGVLLAALLVGFGFTAFKLERGRQMRSVDEELQRRIGLLLDSLRKNPNRAGEKRADPELRLTPAQAALFDDHDGHYFAVWMRGAKLLARSANAPANLARPDAEAAAVRTSGPNREAFLFAAPVDCVLVGRPINSEQDELRNLGALLGAAGGAVLLLGLLGGWWLSSRALRPLAEISATAEKIAGGNLALRINTADTEGELERLAAVLNSTFARLDAAFSQQARFTADAAHELRTPLAVILTQAQLALSRDRSVSEYRETLEATQRAAQRMRRLIESLLDLAKLDGGQEPFHWEPCDLATISREALDLISPLATERTITLHTDLQPASLQGDAERLAQVVTNLLSNALEYNHPGGSLRISTTREHGRVLLVVENTGPAIPPEDLPHIFERFHRADKSRSSTGHAGLGLAIVHAVVKAHGGSVEAASDASNGTRFTVTLPG